MIFAEDIPSSVTCIECVRLAELARGQKVLEVGSWLGRSTIALASTAEKVVAVDWHHGDFYAGEQDTLIDFCANLKRYAVTNVEVIVAKIEDVAPDLPDDFGLVFIDGDHSEEAVTAHWLIAREKVTVPSLIVFHDYGRFGVTAALDAIGLPLEACESLAVIRIDENDAGDDRAAEKSG